MSDKTPDNPDDQQDPRKTGREGGLARASRLPAQTRSEIARQAAQKRWGTAVVPASYTGDLEIGDLTLACAVIDDGTRVTRVISQTTMLEALGRSGRPKSGDAGTVLFAANLQPFISDELRETLKKPITYITPNGARALGYPAEILPAICEVYLEARAQNPSPLRKTQIPAADAAEILVRGLARTGIIALVDEVTGYQEVRAKNDLAKILEAYVTKELQPWVQTFPTDYYREMFRLRGLEFPHSTVKRPQYFGKLTNDIVYKRLAPGVLEELKRVQDRSVSGRPKHKLFQKLTTNVGYPKLREHLGSVVTLMKLSKNWADFNHKLNEIHPRIGDTMVLPFDNSDDAESGLLSAGQARSAL